VGDRKQGVGDREKRTEKSAQEHQFHLFSANDQISV
jgi:hypothetical protein